MKTIQRKIPINDTYLAELFCHPEDVKQTTSGHEAPTSSALCVEDFLTTDLFPVPLDQVLFFDIETTGLSPRASSIYLIGTLYYDVSLQQFIMTQWFADDSKSELVMLSDFLEQLESFAMLCHFNGRTFDIPYVLQKCEKHQIVPSAHCQAIFADQKQQLSYDMLIALRPLKKLLGLSRCNQTSLEAYAGIIRTDQYDGGRLIPIYSAYRQDLLLHPEQAAEKEHLLLLHNDEDLLGMLAVMALLSYRHLFTRKGEPLPALTGLQITCCDSAYLLKQCPDVTVCTASEYCAISFAPEIPVPLTGWFGCSYDDEELHDTCLLSLEQTSGTLWIPMIQTELKYFMKDYKHYYYLPEEDTAIHESVASFVDKEHRKKATAATCYLKKEGSFLPSLCAITSSENTYVFRQDYKAKQCYLAVPEGDTELSSFLGNQLASFLQKGIPLSE